MQNILIVVEGKSYLPMSIKKKLEETSYKVIIVPAATDAIHGIKDTIHCVLLYADKKLIEQQQSLIFLKDWAIMNDTPLFTIGDQELLDAVKSMIPKYLIRQEFLRPIDVNELVDVVDNFMKYSARDKKKILVVDDSGAMLRSVKGWLGDRYNVFLANSAAMAIKYLVSNQPDLILLDYEMPICDGKQVLEMIRAEMEFSDVPVMFLTNKGDTESIVGVKDLKIQAYLLKTMEPFQIIKAVDDFFEKHKALEYMKNA